MNQNRKQNQTETKTYQKAGTEEKQSHTEKTC